MYLRTLVPLPILGFVIFLMVDSEKRFKEFKKSDSEYAKDYERQYALLMTMLVILAIILLTAVAYGMSIEFPDTFKRYFPSTAAAASPSNPAAVQEL